LADFDIFFRATRKKLDYNFLPFQLNTVATLPCKI